MAEEKRRSDSILDRANRGWYEMMHQEGLDLNPAYQPDSADFHPERDLACIADLGVVEDSKDKILVCGCGGGDDTWLLTEKLSCRNVWGVDWSQPAVTYFNTFFRDGKRMNGEEVPVRTTGKAVRADVSELPFDDMSFDYVLALDITEHLHPATYLFFLANCYRILIFGGRIAVLPGMTKRPEHVNLISLLDVAKHMMNIGFHIVSGSLEGQPWIIGEKKPSSVYIEREEN